MNKRNNIILIGIILLLVGLVSVMQGFFHFHVRDITVTAAGLAFLLLYRTKRRSWSLLLGVYLFCFGLIGMVGQIAPASLSLRLVGAMFFVAPGLIFLVMYRNKGTRGLLIPACILIWFGAFLLLSGMPGLGRFATPLFFACIGGGFLTAYGVGRSFMGKYSLYFGVAFLAAAVLFLGGMLPGIGALRRLPQFGGLFLIAASAAVIILGIKRRK